VSPLRVAGWMFVGTLWVVVIVLIAQSSKP